MSVAADTYKHDDKVQYGPKTGEILGKPQGDPLKQHLDDENKAENKVGPVEDSLQLFVLVEVNVLEAQCDAGREDQHQHEPFEGRRVYVLQNVLAKSIPPLTGVGFQTGVPAFAPRWRQKFNGNSNLMVDNVGLWSLINDVLFHRLFMLV